MRSNSVFITTVSICMTAGLATNCANKRRAAQVGQEAPEVLIKTEFPEEPVADIRNFEYFLSGCGTEKNKRWQGTMGEDQELSFHVPGIRVEEVCRVTADLPEKLAEPFQFKDTASSTAYQAAAIAIHADSLGALRGTARLVSEYIYKGQEFGDEFTISLSVLFPAPAGNVSALHPDLHCTPGLKVKGRKVIPGNPAEIRVLIARQSPPVEHVCHKITLGKGGAVAYEATLDPAVAKFASAIRVDKHSLTPKPVSLKKITVQGLTVEAEPGETCKEGQVLDFATGKCVSLMRP